MARILELSDMPRWLLRQRDITRRAASLAVIEATQFATGETKKNIAKVFKGSKGRPKTGNLIDAVRSQFIAARGALEGVVAINLGRAPYARIHELGGIIRPKRANWLWIPLVGPKSGGRERVFRDWTPRDWVKHSRERRPDVSVWMRERFKGPGYVAFASQNKRKPVPVFVLVKQVIMPERPYVTPAVRDASLRLPTMLAKHLEAEYRKAGI